MKKPNETKYFKSMRVLSEQLGAVALEAVAAGEAVKAWGDSRKSKFNPGRSGDAVKAAREAARAKLAGLIPILEELCRNLREMVGDA